MKTRINWMSGIIILFYLCFKFSGKQTGFELILNLCKRFKHNFYPADDFIVALLLFLLPCLIPVIVMIINNAKEIKESVQVQATRILTISLSFYLFLLMGIVNPPTSTSGLYELGTGPGLAFSHMRNNEMDDGFGLGILFFMSIAYIFMTRKKKESAI